MMRNEQQMTRGQKFRLVWMLSIPTILAQVTTTAMEYIDAAMVGSLGAAASAAIGVVASTTWLFGGISSAVTYGFSVQIAQAIGAGDDVSAKRIFRHGMLAVIGFAYIMLILGMLIHGALPRVLGAEESLWYDASKYFMVFSLFLPIRHLNFYCGTALQASGNTRTPGILNIMMCFLDVLFNLILIFESGALHLGGLRLPGAGLGVMGAAIGTGLAELVSLLLMFYSAAVRSEKLRIRRDGYFRIESNTTEKALRIAIPIAVEQGVLSAAMVATTRIVAPIGTIAVAANSFGITAESFCYMPGYGLEAAATTLVGQATGARRADLAKSFAWITTAFGMLIMTVTGLIMYGAAPWVFAFLTPDTAVQALGVQVLRIELLAEPLFAASIVVTGALRGVGDTLVPSVMNLISIWGVRLTLAIVLAPRYGLVGVWIAMCVELVFRGIIFLIRLAHMRWEKAFVRNMA